MGKKNKVSILLVFIIAFFCFSYNINEVKADDEKDEGYCLLCSANEETYKQEQQFIRKIKAFKNNPTIKNSIDEIALAATVLHAENTFSAVASRYDNNFKYSDYQAAINALYVKDSSDDEDAKIDSSNFKSSSGISGNKIDLLNAAALIMADSAGWGGFYNEEKYKEALMSDSMFGNSSANDTMSETYCNVIAGVTDFFDPNGNNSNWYSMKAMCQYGYIGGVYNITPETEPDADRRKAQKEAIANEIIDLIHYYKKLTGHEDKVCAVGGSTTGAELAAIESREERINKIGPAAQAVYSRTGVFASITIAQAIQESNIGAAGTYGRENNNLFGVKCRTGFECKNGYTVFNSIEESIEDRAVMFDNGYYEGWKNTTTPSEFIHLIGPTYCPPSDGCGDYAGTIMTLVNQYDLTKWDVKTNVTNSTSCGLIGSGDWPIRTIKPGPGDSSFVEMERAGNSGNRGQCVWYARGRAYEIVNALKDSGKLTEIEAAKIKGLLARAYGNGGDIYDNAKSVFNSSNDIRQPKAGSYLVWKQPGNYGHVAIVEEVNTTNNTITITEGWTNSGSCPDDSSWSCVQFMSRTLDLDDYYNNFGAYYNGGYYFSGYVYFLEPLI